MISSLKLQHFGYLGLLEPQPQESHNGEFYNQMYQRPQDSQKTSQRSKKSHSTVTIPLLAELLQVGEDSLWRAAQRSEI